MQMTQPCQKVKLSEVARVQSGAGFPERFQGSRGLQFPFYKVSDMNLAGNESEMIYETNSISEETRLQLGATAFPPGSIIFPKVGGAIATNKKRLIVKPACVDNNVMGVIPLPRRISSRLLYYFFQAHDLSEFANDAGLPSIKKSTVENWVLGTIPPLAEQQRIVGVLDEAFAGLATAQANAEKNLENARALFESHLQSVFTHRDEDWVEHPLSTLCHAGKVITYGVVLLGEEVPDGVPCLRTSNVRWLRIDTAGMKRIAPKLSASYPRTVLEGGEVLVNVRGTLGGVGVATAEMLGWNVSREVAVAPIDPKKVNPRFAAYCIGSSVSQEWLGSMKKGAAYVGINIEDLRNLPIHAPSLHEQERLVGHLDTFAAETQRLTQIYQQKQAALAALKKSLLHQAFTGNL